MAENNVEKKSANFYQDGFRLHSYYLKQRQRDIHQIWNHQIHAASTQNP
jgi:hypothetical protein